MSYKRDDSRLSSITTSDPARLQRWGKLFGEGTAVLPVLSDTPRWREDRAKAGDHTTQVPVYDLDASRLTVAQRRQFARHIMKLHEVSFDVAYRNAHTYPIRAAGVQVLAGVTNA